MHPQPTTSDANTWAQFFADGGVAMFPVDHAALKKHNRFGVIVCVVIVALMLSQVAALIWLANIGGSSTTSILVAIFLVGLFALLVRIFFARRALRLPRAASEAYISVSRDGLKVVDRLHVTWSDTWGAISFDLRYRPVHWYSRFGALLLRSSGAPLAEFVVGLNDAAATKANQPPVVHSAFVTTFGVGGLRVPVDNCIARDEVETLLVACYAAAYIAGVPAVYSRQPSVVFRWMGLLGDARAFDPAEELRKMEG